MSTIDDLRTLCESAAFLESVKQARPVVDRVLTLISVHSGSFQAVSWAALLWVAEMMAERGCDDQHLEQAIDLLHTHFEKARAHGQDT